MVKREQSSGVVRGACAALLLAGAMASTAGAGVIFSNALTENRNGLTSGAAAGSPGTATWNNPVSGTAPYFANVMSGGTGQTSYAWATTRVTNAGDLSALAANGFSVSADFSVVSPSRTTTATNPSNSVGLGALGNTASFQRYSTSIAFFYAHLSTLGPEGSTPGALSIGAQNLAGQGSSGGTIASGPSFVGTYQTGSSGTAGNWSALSGTYHMVFSGTYDASDNLTLSFTVSNLDGSNAVTLTTSAISGTVLPSATNSYFGLRDVAANGGATDRYNNVVLATVPEPAMAGLAAIGGLGFLARRRKSS